MDKRKLYIDLLAEYCNKTTEEAEAAIDEALRKREEKRRRQGDEHMFTMQ